MMVTQKLLRGAVGLLLVATCQCSQNGHAERDEERGATEHVADESPQFAKLKRVADAGGDATALYNILRHSREKDLSPREWVALQHIVRTVPDAVPPESPAKVTYRELVHAHAFADLREGAWRSRLPSMWSSSEPGAVTQLVDFLKRTNRYSSQIGWQIVKALKEHPDLDECWIQLASRIDYETPMLEEDKPVAPPPVLPPNVPLLPSPTATDWSYLDNEDISRIVLRERVALGSKWLFMKQLYNRVPKGTSVESIGTVMAELVNRATEDVRGKLELGGRTAKGLPVDRKVVRQVVRSLGEMQDEVLRRFVLQGPVGDDRDEGVAGWIQLCAHELRLSQYPLGDNTLADIAAALDPWVKKFPGLEEAARKLRQVKPSPFRSAGTHPAHKK